MKIHRFVINDRKSQLEIHARNGQVLAVPFAKLTPRPTKTNRIHEAHVDKELGNEAVTYSLASGAEGSVHIDYALEYNRDPGYLAELLVHQLTVEAGRRLERSGLSRRELARRLNTSLPHLYRLLDPANTRKGIGQLVSLLYLLDCDVRLVVQRRRAA